MPSGEQNVLDNKNYTASPGEYLAVLSFLKPWINVFTLPEKFSMAVTEKDLDPKVRKMSITY